MDILLGSKYASTPFFTEDKPSLIICTFYFVIQRIEKIKNFLPSKEKIAAKLKLYLEVVYIHSSRANRTAFSLVLGPSLITVYIRFPKWNSLRVLFHCSHFDRNEISFRMIYTPKWNPLRGNICACKFFIKAGLVDQKFKTKFLKTNVNIILVMAKRNFISGKLNFGSHVNTLGVNTYVYVCICVINSE